MAAARQAPLRPCQDAAARFDVDGHSAAPVEPAAAPKPVGRKTPKGPEPLPRLLTVEEVAEICRVTGRTVRRWIADGELATYRLGGRVLVSENDLAAFLRSCRG